MRGSNRRGLQQDNRKNKEVFTTSPTRGPTQTPTMKPLTVSPTRAPTRSPTIHPTQFPTSTPPPGVGLLGYMSVQFSLWSPPLVDLYSPTTTTAAIVNETTASAEASRIVQKLQHESIVSVVLESFLCLETPLALVPLQAFEPIEGSNTTLTPWEQALSQDVCQAYQTKTDDNGIRRSLQLRIRQGTSRGGGRRALSNSAFTLQDDEAVLGQIPTVMVVATRAAPTDNGATQEEMGGVVVESIAFTQWKLSYSVWGQEKEEEDDDEQGVIDHPTGSSLALAIRQLEGLIQLELDNRIRGGHLDQQLHTRYEATNIVDVLGDYNFNRTTMMWASIPGHEYTTFSPHVSELNAAEDARNNNNNNNSQPTPFSSSNDNLLFYIGVIVLVVNSIFVCTMLRLGARHRRSRLRDEQFQARSKGGLVTMEGLDYVLDAKHIQHWADVHASPARNGPPVPASSVGGGPARISSSHSSENEFYDVAMDDTAVVPKNGNDDYDDDDDDDGDDDESVNNALYAIPSQFSTSPPPSKKGSLRSYRS
jgi:hypothetical protein